MFRPTTSLGASYCSQIEPLLASYLQQWRLGRAPEIGAFAAQHPEYAADIAELLPAMILAEQAAAPGAPALSEYTIVDHPKTLGVYQLHREIGRGGMGVVYEATQVEFSQKFAVKVLVNRVLPSSTLHSRFIREAESSSRLHHSNIVPSKFYGSEGAFHYLVMPLIDGISLDRLIAHVPSNDREIQQLFDDICCDWRSVSQLGAKVASALHYSHENGIIHRDIKPANLILDRKGNPWVTDFGLAKLFEEDNELSRTGELIGTPRYMSPEQFFGVPDARSDVYSLGLTLYEILATRKLDELPKVKRSEKRTSALEIADLRTINPNVPAALSKIIMKACSHHPESRHASAHELEVALNSVTYYGCDDRRALSTYRPSVHKEYRRSSGMMAAIALTSCLSYPLLTRPLYSVTQSVPPSTTVKHAPSDYMPPPTYCLAYDEPGTNLVNVQVFVCARSDDVEQYEDGTMYIDSTDLEFTWDETEQIIGLRFPGVDIPRNAEIRSATLCFYATRSDLTPTELFIHGIDDTNPPTFSVFPFDVSKRVRTKQNVRWTPGPWTRDELFESPSCVGLVQHAVNQPGWRPGNAIAFVVDGKGSRTAVTFDGNIHSSPMLKIQYVKPAAN